MNERQIILEQFQVKLSWKDTLLKAKIMRKAGYTVAVDKETKTKMIIWPNGRIESFKRKPEAKQ